MLEQSENEKVVLRQGWDRAGFALETMAELIHARVGEAEASKASTEALLSDALSTLRSTADAAASKHDSGTESDPGAIESQEAFDHKLRAAILRAELTFAEGKRHFQSRVKGVALVYGRCSSR